MVCVGTQDYKKSLDTDAWAYCYTTECCKPPELFPPEFAIAAERILRVDLHLEKYDITINNAKFVYLYLLSKF